MPIESELAELSRIGADVPFFAAQMAAAHVAGIGERVEALPPLDAHVVLVQSGDGLSTAEVFAELRPEEWGSAANDLLAPALRLRPRLADVMALMTAAGGEPRAAARIAFQINRLRALCCAGRRLGASNRCPDFVR